MYDRTWHYVFRTVINAQQTEISWEHERCFCDATHDHEIGKEVYRPSHLIITYVFNIMSLRYDRYGEVCRCPKTRDHYKEPGILDD